MAALGGFVDHPTPSTLGHHGGLTSATPGLPVVSAGGGLCLWDLCGAGTGQTGLQSRQVGSDQSSINICMVVFEILP